MLVWRIQSRRVYRDVTNESGNDLLGLSNRSLRRSRRCAISSITGRPFRAAANMSGWRWKRPAPAYTDVARSGNGMAAMMKMMEARKGTPPFAPPFLKAGKLVIGADRQHPALSRGAPWAGAEGGSRKIVGASAAAHDRRFRAGSSRHPSSARALALLRGPEGAGEKAHGRILEGARAEISRLFRGAGGAQWRRLRHRPPR